MTESIVLATDIQPIYQQAYAIIFLNSHTMLPNTHTRPNVRHQGNPSQEQTKNNHPHLSPPSQPTHPLLTRRWHLCSNLSKQAQSRSGKKSRKGSMHKLFVQAHRTHFKQTFLSTISLPLSGKSKQSSPRNNRVVECNGGRAPSCRRSEILKFSQEVNIKIDPKQHQNQPQSTTLSQIILQLVGEKMTIAQLSTIREIRDDFKPVESLLDNNDSFIKDILTNA